MTTNYPSWKHAFESAETVSARFFSFFHLFAYDETRADRRDAVQSSKPLYSVSQHLPIWRFIPHMVSTYGVVVQIPVHSLDGYITLIWIT